MILLFWIINRFARQVQLNTVTRATGSPVAEAEEEAGEEEQQQPSAAEDESKALFIPSSADDTSKAIVLPPAEESLDLGAHVGKGTPALAGDAGDVVEFRPLAHISVREPVALDAHRAEVGFERDDLAREDAPPRFP